MPELFLGPKASMLDAAPLYYKKVCRVILLAHMYLPAEESRRNAMIATYTGTALDQIHHRISAAKEKNSLKSVAKLRRWRRYLTKNFYDAHGRHTNIAGSLLSGPVINQTCMMKGATSGLMLFTASCLMASGYDDKHGPSKSKAEFFIEKVAAHRPRAQGLYKDRSAMERAWSEYGCVSHFWAAWYYLTLRSKNSQGSKKTPTQVVQDSPLQCFLETAAYFQDHLTSWKPHGRTQPIVTREQTWTLPSNLPLYGPAVDLRSFGSTIAEVLESYSASRT